MRTLTGSRKSSFNTQPPEGGWKYGKAAKAVKKTVSTHSRPKAAGGTSPKIWADTAVSTHSRPKAAGTSSD